jgi:hypothetical protein
MSQEKKKELPDVSSAPEAVAEEFESSLETIKEILVGENTRDIIKKLAALDERTKRELTELQEQVMRRIDSLESFIRKEILLVHDDLRSEQSERTGAVHQTAGELTRVSEALEKKLGQTTQVASQQFQETREQLQTQSRSLADEIVRGNKALYTEIERLSASIEARKPDRQLLAAMFVRMASALQSPVSAGEEQKVTSLKSKELKKSG